MGHLGSGGSTPPQNWWADLPSSPLLASLSPAVIASVLFSPTFFISVLPTVALLIFLFLFFYRYDTVASFLHPSMAVDPQADFVGDIKVNNNPPTKATLEKVANLPVLDADKKSRTFKSLYADNEDGPRRVLICFIRHFFCGNCQEYIRTLSTAIPPSSLTSLTPPTSIIIIGCGQPDLIPMYIRETSCPYPIYADPTRALYQKLGMTQTLSLGPTTPSYIKKSLLTVIIEGFYQEMRAGRNMLSGGAPRQVGGEFVFEGGKVVWCKRMRNTRDHAEIPEIKQHLGLLGEAKAPEAEEVATTTTTARKRASMSGLGGLGRRFSQRRQSWGGSRSRSRATIEKTGNNEKAGTSPPPPAVIDEAKEEGTTSEDALAKLEGRGGAGGVRVVDEEKEKVGDGDVVVNGNGNGKVDGLTNGNGTAVAA